MDFRNSLRNAGSQKILTGRGQISILIVYHTTRIHTTQKFGTLKTVRVTEGGRLIQGRYIQVPL